LAEARSLKGRVAADILLQEAGVPKRPELKQLVGLKTEPLCSPHLPFGDNALPAKSWLRRGNDQKQPGDSEHDCIVHIRDALGVIV
jgi:hypothetical protein